MQRIRKEFGQCLYCINYTAGSNCAIDPAVFVNMNPHSKETPVTVQKKNSLS